MKRTSYIFILLICFGVKAISANIEPFFALKQLSGINKKESHSKEKSPVSIINTKEYPSSNKFLSEKRNNLRGLTNVCNLFTYKCPLLVILSCKKLIHSSQIFYSLRLFLGNEKRGPPTVLFS